MSSPKKAVELSKAVLNLTTYKAHPGNEFADVQQYVTVDITDLLKKNGVDSVYQVDGVSAIESGGMVEDGEVLSMLPTFTDPQIRLLNKEVFDVIDAAIVNEKQSKAIKKLIDQKFEDFISEHWDPIRKCKFTKEYYDRLLDEEMSEN